MRYPQISLNTNKSNDTYHGYERISLNGYHHGYERMSFMICKDIFFHSRYSRVYPFISFISSNLFINIQLFIRLYPSIYPLISIHILFFYPNLYSYISTSYPTFLSFCILLFIPFYPDIYPAGYSIRFSADSARRGVLLNRTLICISCSAKG
jgi:hypothetical protein